MYRQRPVFAASLALGLGIAVLPSGTAVIPPPPDGPRLAFSLDEMNCFSSDIRLRDTEAATASDEASALRLAAGSSGGTNGIPCNARDPKAPPKQRSRT
jgi:hypothetical protein